jgi:hypothetical protein
VVNRALKQNPGGQRFFLLSLPPQTSALMATAARPLAEARARALAANGVLLVCQRDIDHGRINAAALAPGVIPVRGWPPAGSSEIPLGERYFKDEDRTTSRHRTRRCAGCVPPAPMTRLPHHGRGAAPTAGNCTAVIPDR